MSIGTNLTLALSACVLVATCTGARAYRSDQQPMFGTYSQKYLDKRQQKRWQALCKGEGRYQAMSEAAAAGKPSPCKP
jgi:hypothetical protein